MPGETAPPPSFRWIQWSSMSTGVRTPSVRFCWRRQPFRGCWSGRGGHSSSLGRRASLRGRANFSSFAAAKAALRMTAQSLAREFGPKGIHVAHVVVDGVIDGDRARAFIANADERFGEDGMLQPDRIAETYLMLHRQHRSAWTHELDLRDR